MEHRKQGARLLGFLAVGGLGVMVFATSAQAVAPGFLINKAAWKSLVTVKGTLEGTSTMLVPGLNFQLSCRTLTTDQGAIESKTDAVGILLYGGCTTLSISKFPEEIHCHVREPITAEALLLPAELKKPILDGPAILAEKIKALISLELKGKALPGEEPISPCVLPLDSIMTGEVCFQIINNDTPLPLLITNASIECLETVALESLTMGAGLIDKLKYGAQTMTLDGAALLHALSPAEATLGVSLY
jgi:hypothetical protein